MGLRSPIESVKTLNKVSIVQHFALIHLLIVFATVMVILNVNLVVVVIKQFVNHNAHVDQVVLVDVHAATPQLSATFVKLMNALTSRMLF